MALETIQYKNRKMSIINQLLLPQQTVYVDIKTVQDGWEAIKSMQVRGAPAIAVVGALSLAVEMNGKTFAQIEELTQYVDTNLDYLITARPTAVNIFRASNDIREFVKLQIGKGLEVEQLKEKIIVFIEDMLTADVKDNLSIGEHGMEHILKNVKGDELVILTHCNAGALATVNYGTALGVVRSLHNAGKLKHVFCTETRAYNQGARLTAYELVHEGIPSTLITDSSVSIAMARKNISAVVVGADRVAMNGDTANKIGTYQIAISAKHHGVPFYIAAPTTTIDQNIKTGSDIVIEERNHEEITHYKHERVAAEGIGCWNPAFDVTPANLITGGIITEHGVFVANELVNKLKS